MFLESPQANVPSPAKTTAVWFAPLRPKTLLNRPYKGVNVHVASKYLKNTIIFHLEAKGVQLAYDVPSQLAWFDFSKSEEIDDKTLSLNLQELLQVSAKVDSRVATKVAAERIKWCLPWVYEFSYYSVTAHCDGLRQQESFPTRRTVDLTYGEECRDPNTSKNPISSGPRYLQWS